jgi:hypothetical protein
MAQPSPRQTWFPVPKKSHALRSAFLGIIAAFGLLFAGCAVLVGGVLSGLDSTIDKSAPRQPIEWIEESTVPGPPAPRATPPPVKRTPLVFDTVTAREWKLIAKNPGAHKGRRIVVYGRIDSATGTGAFRAEVGAVRRRPGSDPVDYPTKAILKGSKADLEDGDLVTAKVTVGGPTPGSATTPLLVVHSLTVTGSE